MLKSLLAHQVLPFICASVIAAGVVYSTSPLRDTKVNSVLVVKGTQSKQSGVHPNLEDSVQSEIDFAGSLLNKEQLTLFGSSEFNSSPYAPYNFLPDSLGIPALGVGHAYHQQLSILCELLAMRGKLTDSKVVVVLSPSWFKAGKGSNSAAFIEFVIPNFLNKIAADENLDVKYKAHIGRFIYAHRDDFSVLSPSMKILVDAYLRDAKKPLPILKSDIEKKILDEYATSPVSYEVSTLKNGLLEKGDFDWGGAKARTKNAFTASVSNNEMWVNDTYYSKYVLQKDGSENRVGVDAFELTTSEELKDFELLAELLAETGADCRFIIQPMNPFFYEDLGNYKPVLNQVKSSLEQKGIGYFDMYVTDTDSYEPGVLRDVMHLGDYGWMQINQYLFEQYYE